MSAPRRTVHALLASAILAALAWYVWHARRELAMVLHLDPRYLLPMVAVPLGNLLVNGRIGRDLAAEFGVPGLVLMFASLVMMHVPRARGVAVYGIIAFALAMVFTLYSWLLTPLESTPLM